MTEEKNDVNVTALPGRKHEEATPLDTPAALVQDLNKRVGNIESMLVVYRLKSGDYNVVITQQPIEHMCTSRVLVDVDVVTKMLDVRKPIP